MRLELLVHPVNAVRWGGRTTIEGDALVVDRDALCAYVAGGLPFATLNAELAAPGESCRIAPVFDVVEPRAKLGDGTDFPGILGPPLSAGQGQTVVLRGAATVTLDPNGEMLRQNAVIDMGGVGAAYSRYALTHNVVLLPMFEPGVERPAQRYALRVASLRAAVYLARAAAAAEPAMRETLALDPPAGRLPRVAYVFQLTSQQYPTAPGEPILYGDNVRHLLPTILHPNEILDGALVRNYRPFAMETYSWQNHPVILDLYARQGRELEFAGVVVTVAHQTREERERAVTIAANLVAHTLRADGAILSKSGGGAPHVDMAQVAHRLEGLGVRTTMLAWDLSAGDEDGGALFNYPTLDAIVNYGSSNFTFDLPPVERLIAGRAGLDHLRGAYRADSLELCGAMNQVGAGRLTAVTY